MAYVTPIYGGSAAQVDYRLGITEPEHGCASDAQVRYHADGAVYEILKNPNYTGYQVFNRRASRSRSGKVNDPVKWVWSPEPVHEPLIPKWMYDELSARRAAKRGSRDGSSSNTHPKTRRTYVLRGMVFHGCGRRMYGNHRHNSGYYMCHPMSNNRGRPDKYAGHEKAAYIREDLILEAVSAFFADRVFGPHRRELLAADLSTVDDRETRQREADRDRLQRSLADLARRQNNVMRQAQDCAPDDPFAQGLRQNYNELETERRAALATVAELDAADNAAPARPSPDDAGLLDALPPRAHPGRRTRGATTGVVRIHQAHGPAPPQGDRQSREVSAWRVCRGSQAG